MFLVSASSSPALARQQSGNEADIHKENQPKNSTRCEEESKAAALVTDPHQRAASTTNVASVNRRREEKWAISFMQLPAGVLQK